MKQQQQEAARKAIVDATNAKTQLKQQQEAAKKAAAE
jgi:hypothetical protein